MERARLYPVNGDATYNSSFFRIKHKNFVFGSSEHCDVRIYIDGIFPEHCVLTVGKQGNAFLEPLHPSALIFVNYVRITQKVCLNDNDVVTVLKKDFRFAYPHNNLLSKMMVRKLSILPYTKQDKLTGFSGKRITQNFFINHKGKGLSTLANENYLRSRYKELKDHEKQVILKIDEIFIKSAITYKCNKIIGFTKKGEAATTIQCFLYSSLLSKNKEIVSLNPVKNMNAEDLYSMTVEILSLMEKVGFSVVCIVSDNNRVNRNCFSKLCNGTIKSVIQNPANNAKKLHL
ncbi:FHA domain-containing protein [Trichonephila clavipes]|nr:FHA domain-containing protein [Trichonephila clavipes]